MLKKRKVLVFFDSVLSPIKNPDLAYCEKIRKKGDEVIGVICGSRTPGCMFNPEPNWITCLECSLKSKWTYRQYCDRVLMRPKAKKEWDEVYQNLIKDIQFEQEEFSKIAYENFDIGYSILSQTFNFCPDDEVDIKRDVSFVLNRIKYCLFAYLAAREIIAEIQPDCVSFFNGRSEEQRAFFRAAEYCKVNVDSYEIGADAGKLEVFEGNWVQDRNLLQKKIMEYWQRENVRDSARAIAVGKNWFEKRRVSKESNRFIKEFKRKESDYQYLIDDSSDKPFYLICTSTWREKRWVDKDWRLPIYETQLGVLKKMIEMISNNGYQEIFVIRMHPNQDNAPLERDKILELKSKNIIIIPPGDPIDTYELMEKSKCVISFGSTVGVEACYWGIPSVVYGNTKYGSLGVCDSFHDLNSLFDYLPKVKAYPRDNSLKYGLFFSEYGENFVPPGKDNPLLTFVFNKLRGIRARFKNWKKTKG